MEYRLDPHDRVIATSADWDPFALSNAGYSALSRLVVGRPIQPFIADELTRAWFANCLEAARRTGRPVFRQYRCDSPTHRRFMRMEIGLGEDRTVGVRHETFRVEEREYPMRYVRARGDAPAAARCCSICHQLRFAGLPWYEADTAIRRSGRREPTGLSVTWTLCATCTRDAALSARELA